MNIEGIDYMLMDFSEQKFDIILQAGQSNSAGCGFGAIKEPFEPSERIWYFNNDFTITKAEEVVWDKEKICNFSLPFAALYEKSGLLDEQRKILVVRAAINGTGFIDKHWGLEDPLYLNMVKMTETALSINKENRLVCFLWHQGETDSELGATYNLHYNNLITMVKTVRNIFSCKNLPFICGDFVHDWKNKNLAICEPVIKAMRAVCNDLGNAAFVETDGLTSNDQANGGGDIIHFSREALMELGERYFNGYCKLIGLNINR